MDQTTLYQRIRGLFVPPPSIEEIQTVERLAHKMALSSLGLEGKIVMDSGEHGQRLAEARDKLWESIKSRADQGQSWGQIHDQF